MTEDPRARQKDDPDHPVGLGADLDYRFTLANERTFLAWVRTALGLLAGSVAMVHLVPDAGSSPAPLERTVGFVLAGLGTAVALAGFRRWRRVQVAMERGGRLPASRDPLWLALAVAGLAAILLVMVAR